MIRWLWLVMLLGSAIGAPNDYELEEKADDFYYRGSAADTDEDWDDAIRYLAQAISIYDFLEKKAVDAGDDDQADFLREMLVDAYQMIGRNRRNRDGFASARTAFEALLEIHEEMVKAAPKDVEVLVTAAEVYEESASYAEGESELKWRQRALELRSGEDAPRDPDARWARFGSLAGIGKVKLDEDDIDGAEEDFHEALEIGEKLINQFPHNLVWIDALANVYENLGKVERARGDHDASLGWFRKAVRMIVKGREMVPESATNRWIGREAYFRNEAGLAIYYDGRFADAIDEFARAAKLKDELDPAKHNWARQIIASSHNFLGYANATQDWDGIERSLQNFEDALEILEELDSERQESRIQSYTARRDAAQQLLDARDAFDEDDADTWYELAEVIREVDNLRLSDALEAEGLDLYAKIPSAAKSYPKALIRRVDMLQDEERWEDALSLLEEVRLILDAKLEDGDEEAAEWAWQAQVRTGSCLMEVRRLADAATFLQRGVEIAEDYDEISLSNRRYSHFLIAEVYGQLGDHQLAFDHQERNLELSIELYTPRLDSPSWRDELVTTYGNMSWRSLFVSEYDQAIEAGEAGLKLQYENWIAGNVAHGYLLSGQYEKAKEIYLRHQGEPIRETDDTLFERIARVDFDEFRAAGIEHPDMVRIEKLLGVDGPQPD